MASSGSGFSVAIFWEVEQPEIDTINRMTSRIEKNFSILFLFEGTKLRKQLYFKVKL